MMAEGDKKRRVRKTETVRDRKEKVAAKAEKPKKRRIRKTVKTISRPLGIFKVFRFIVPSYFKNAWSELREVSWPGRQQTIQLTLAVFMFAIVFGLMIAVTDYGLDKVFRKVLLQ